VAEPPAASPPGYAEPVSPPATAPRGPSYRPPPNAWWLSVVCLLAACSSPAATTTTPTEPVTTAFPATTSTAATTTTSPETTAPAPDTPVRLTIVYDNTVYDARLGAAWGFSALVEAPGGTLLFDTGGDGALLLANMAALGIDPASIETVVLSHEHDDHAGGLPALLQAGADPTVYVPASFPAGPRAQLAAETAVVDVSAPQQILPGVFSTGEMGGAVPEQGLVIATAAGTVLLTGCAHPGIVAMVERARELVPGDIHLVVGGFHLAQESPATVAAIVAAFRDLGVQRVAPAHCTGEAAIAAFAREYGGDFIPAGAGAIIEIG